MDYVKDGVVGIGVGVFDDQMEKWDSRTRRTKAFQTATDLGRLGVVVLGLIADQFLRQPVWGEKAVVAALPLLTKSAIKAFAGATTATSTASFAARRAISRPVPGNGADQGIIISST